MAQMIAKLSMRHSYFQTQVWNLKDGYIPNISQARNGITSSRKWNTINPEGSRCEMSI